MRSITSFLFAILATLSFVLSLISFIWWLVFAYNMAIGDTAVELGSRFAPALAAQVSPQQILLMQAREYFVLIGGAVGWSAFFALPHFSSRPFHRLPRLLLVSCAIGITAAIVMPAASLFKAAPILAVILTLMRCVLIDSASTDGPAQRDAES
jgi:hypothetical protein